MSPASAGTRVAPARYPTGRPRWYATGPAPGRTEILPRVIGPAATVMVWFLVLVLIVAGAWFLTHTNRASATDLARQRLREAAGTEAVDLCALDYTSFDQDFHRMLDGSTGALRSALVSQRDYYADLVSGYRLRARGVLVESGVLTMTETSATVLVAVDQEIGTGSGDDPPMGRRHHRLEIDMSRVDGQWLAAAVRIRDDP